MIWVESGNQPEVTITASTEAGTEMIIIPEPVTGAELVRLVTWPEIMANTEIGTEVITAPIKVTGVELVRLVIGPEIVEMTDFEAEIAIDPMVVKIKVIQIKEVKVKKLNGAREGEMTTDTKGKREKARPYHLFLERRQARGAAWMSKTPAVALIVEVETAGIFRSEALVVVVLCKAS
jgi:hypothetical protein